MEIDKVSKLITFLVLITFFSIILAIIYNKSELFLIQKTARLNNKSYGIQEIFSDQDIAVEMLAKLHQNMTHFVEDLKRKKPNDPRVKRLYNGFNRVKIEEAPDEDDSTSYTINKGELMALCLREKNDVTSSNRPFHDYNTLLFVIIHEMAHIASITEGHNTEFIENFKFLLTEAHSLGYYNPVDYKSNPIKYCGLKVTNNPFF